MPRKRTHWEGCWRERTHHKCALVRIAALEMQLAAERERLEAKKLEVDAAMDCYKAALNAMRKDWREMFESTQAAGVELAAERGRRETALQAGRDLIAIVHGDGGHYCEAHGDRKAADDAIAIVSKLRVDLDAERKRREDAEALLHNYSRLADAAMFDANRSGYEYDRKGEMVDISAHFARYKD